VSDDLREQVFLALTGWAKVVDGETVEDYEAQADAVLAVFAERERLLRERIEALPVAWIPGMDEEDRAVWRYHVLEALGWRS
jgi:hypothetical protein